MRFPRNKRRNLRVETLEDRHLLAADTTLNLTVRETFAPGVPVLVEAEVVDAKGNIDSGLWDATVELSIGDGDFNAEPLQLVNGRGSTLVTFGDTLDKIDLLASLGEMEASAELNPIDPADINALSGELAVDTTVAGVVQITNDLVIPEGVTLTLASGTLVLLDGDANSATGRQIEVFGQLLSLGTAESPVTLTASDPNEAWGEIDIRGGTVELNHTMITRAGSSPRGGHTNTGPALRLRDGGSLSLLHSAVSDISGKVMEATSGEARIIDSLLTRAVMGPEIDDTGLDMRDSWIIDMAGRFHHNGKVDDNDGIYLHSQRADQVISLDGVVVASIQDDAIDTLGSDVTIRNTIVRDADDKAVSVFNGEVFIDRSLLVNSAIGVETKGSGSSTPDTRIDRTTIANVDAAVRAHDKGSPDPDVVITYEITNSILHVHPNGTVLETDYDPEDFRVNYSLLLQEWSHPGSGTGNRQAVPNFVDPANNDFRLLEGSEAIDAGHPDQFDDDGTRLDLGFYPFVAAAIRGDFNEDQTVDARDIDILCQGIQANPNDLTLDLDENGAVEHDDFLFLVEDLLASGPGDANLDQAFNSSDLVQVFQRGQYEDGVAGNSGWADGDWNCDGEFSSSDLVVAFQSGRYEAPAPNATIRWGDLAAAVETETKKRELS